MGLAVPVPGTSSAKLQPSEAAHRGLVLPSADLHLNMGNTSANSGPSSSRSGRQPPPEPVLPHNFPSSPSASSRQAPLSPLKLPPPNLLAPSVTQNLPPSDSRPGMSPQQIVANDHLQSASYKMFPGSGAIWHQPTAPNISTWTPQPPHAGAWQALPHPGAMHDSASQASQAGLEGLPPPQHCNTVPQNWPLFMGQGHTQVSGQPVQGSHQAFSSDPSFQQMQPPHPHLWGMPRAPGPHSSWPGLPPPPQPPPFQMPPFISQEGSPWWPPQATSHQPSSQAVDTSSPHQPPCARPPAAANAGSAAHAALSALPTAQPPAGTSQDSQLLGPLSMLFPASNPAVVNPPHDPAVQKPSYQTQLQFGAVGTPLGLPARPESHWPPMQAPEYSTCMPGLPFPPMAATHNWPGSGGAWHGHPGPPPGSGFGFPGGGRGVPGQWQPPQLQPQHSHSQPTEHLPSELAHGPGTPPVHEHRAQVSRGVPVAPPPLPQESLRSGQPVMPLQVRAAVISPSLLVLCSEMSLCIDMFCVMAYMHA
jgi:hypothetical protein